MTSRFARHAEVRYDEGAYRAHDVGSLNGTYSIANE